MTTEHATTEHIENIREDARLSDTGENSPRGDKNGIGMTNNDECRSCGPQVAKMET